MLPCISQATILSTPLEEDLAIVATSGWPAVELWLTKLENHLASHPVGELRTRLSDLGLQPAAAAGQGGLLLSEGDARQAHWDLYRRRLETLQALGVPVLILAADAADTVHPEHYGRAADALADAAELARSHNLTLALEFQKTSRLCASLDTALALIAHTGQSNLGLCLDLFHYYCGPSKLEDLASVAASHIAWVQLCDLAGTPRELAGDADRIFPGEGDFHPTLVLQQLARLGYQGYVSLELLNPQLWNIPADRVAEIGLRALIRTLNAAGLDSVAGDPHP